MATATYDTTYDITKIITSIENDFDKVNFTLHYNIHCILFQYMSSLEKSAAGDVKMYFNTESDSNLTPYEKLSNEMKICTISKVKKVGIALHTFLRIIVDNNYEYWFHLLDTWTEELELSGKEKTSFTIEEIFDF